jgi:hypothetical protein
MPIQIADKRRAQTWHPINRSSMAEGGKTDKVDVEDPTRVMDAEDATGNPPQQSSKGACQT